MKDPFLTLYIEIQEIWNIKKGLDYSRPSQEDRIIKKLEKFAESLPNHKDDLMKEIEHLKKLYSK